MACHPGKVRFGLTVLGFQAFFVVMFGIFVRYDDSADARGPPQTEANTLSSSGNSANSSSHQEESNDYDNSPALYYYPMFQDVHVMMFIGFGFLMTFLKRYGFSSVGFNMLIAAFVLQWAIIFSGVLHLIVEAGRHGLIIPVKMTKLLSADFTAATILITFGAVLGKTSPLQMIIIAFIEVIVFTINEYIGLEILQVIDVGGSIFVHTFGAYFGLAVARVLWHPDIGKSKSEGSVYNSDVFAMIGTIFLWLYWPSFNAGLAQGDDRNRAVINTYISLAACCVVTFAISALMDEKGKLSMVHIQNATLAGGVAVGTSADMMIHPVGAAIIGSLAGALSTIGYVKIHPFLHAKLKIHDTCGVNNLHGMPGLLAGITSAIAAGIASPALYGQSLGQQFPAVGNGRSTILQGAFQFAALILTFVIAIISGALTGLLVKLPLFDEPNPQNGQDLFNDNLWWEVPLDDEDDHDKDKIKDGADEKLMQQSNV